MLCLDIKDVLRAMQATRTMRDTVNDSIKVQRLIGLLPNSDADFLALPWAGFDGTRGNENSFHGFCYDDYGKRFCCSYDSRYDDMQMGAVPDPRELNEADFVITTESDVSLFKFGSRCRNLSLCQPPVAAMEIYELCEHCEGRFYEFVPNKVGEVKPSNGAYITVGDIYSSTIKTRAAHRQRCRKPKAKANISIEFQGSVPLRGSDPIMVLRQQREYADKHYHFWWNDPLSEGVSTDDNEA